MFAQISSAEKLMFFLLIRPDVRCAHNRSLSCMPRVFRHACNKLDVCGVCSGVPGTVLRAFAIEGRRTFFSSKKRKTAGCLSMSVLFS